MHRRPVVTRDATSYAAVGAAVTGFHRVWVFATPLHAQTAAIDELKGKIFDAKMAHADLRRRPAALQANSTARHFYLAARAIASSNLDEYHRSLDNLAIAGRRSIPRPSGLGASRTPTRAGSRCKREAVFGPSHLRPGGEPARSAEEARRADAAASARRRQDQIIRPRAARRQVQRDCGLHRHARTPAPDRGGASYHQGEAVWTGVTVGSVCAPSLRGRAAFIRLRCSDAISARLAEDLGFEAGTFAGSIASFTVLGAPDIVMLTLTEFAQQAYRINRAGALPLLVDADHGYGNALNVKRTVEELETAGVAGLTIEDTAVADRLRRDGTAPDPDRRGRWQDEGRARRPAGQAAGHRRPHQRHGRSPASKIRSPG